MPIDSIELSQEQWQFLATLAAIDEPVHIDLAGAVSPILPGKFMALLPVGEKNGWIHPVKNEKYFLSPDIPAIAKNKIQQINHPEKISELIQTLQTKNLTNQISLISLIGLYTKANQSIPAARAERKLALDAVNKKDGNTAYSILHNCVNRLDQSIGTVEADKLYLLAVLELSTLCFTLGKATNSVLKALKTAIACAKRMGDKRSLALIHLHLGRLQHVSGQHVRALSALSSGLQMVKALGDEDIKEEAAVFIGIYYYIQGRFKTAVNYFEQALKGFQYGGTGFVKSPEAPILYGYCSAYLGNYNTAIGSLDCYRQLARDRSDFGLAATLQAILGMILVLINKPDAGKYHLNESLVLAIETENALALYLARGGLAFQYFSSGRIEKAYTIAKKTIFDGIQAGFVFQYSSPWILEMFFEFNRRGCTFPGINIQEEFYRINEGANKHLKGVYLRLQVKPIFGEKSLPIALLELGASIDLIKPSGDKLQLAKSWLEVARLKKKSGDWPGAKTAARKAWTLIQPYGDVFFPEDLADLLAPSDMMKNPGEIREDFLIKALGIIEEIHPSEDPDTILSGIVTIMTQLFHAERGALISFQDGNADLPIVKSGYCLSKNQVIHQNFKRQLKIIYQAFQTKKPFMVTHNSKNFLPDSNLPGSIVCLPVRIGNRFTGVLFHENTYSPDILEFLDMSILAQLSRHISTCMDRHIDFGRVKGERNLLASENVLKEDALHRYKIVTECRVMQHLLQKADQVARSDSTVLILGETGVGKELLAQRLHKKSQKRSGPYVVMDLSSIPENLLESELFGHEKGAFTGADGQRRGRIELAHNGTLFIDEIGEISKGIQVKLLRTLQEKTYSRVGGSRVMTSDFRLVAATNRDLEAEVSAGRFREDLYYRLNVIPILLPPLREREKDILLLSHHFIKTYAKKYGRENVMMTQEDEELLRAYHWPGNIRELKNVIERAVILSSDNRLDIHLSTQKNLGKNPFSDQPSIDEIQRRYIRYILDHTGKKLSGPGGAADILGLKRQTLYARMKKLNVTVGSKH